MNVALNIKESQLRGVLEVLERIGRSVDITINIEEQELKVEEQELKIEEQELKEKSGSLTTVELERIQDEMKGE